MGDDLRTQIRLNFNQQETEVLLEIWRTNDRAEWSEMAFDVIREILRERHIELPAQGEPLYETHKQKSPVAEKGQQGWPVELSSPGEPVYQAHQMKPGAVQGDRQKRHIPPQDRPVYKAHRPKSTTISSDQPKPQASTKQTMYTWLAKLVPERWTSLHTLAAFVGSLALSYLGSLLVLELMSSLHKPGSALDRLIWIAGAAIAIGGTLIVIILLALAGLFGALILHDLLLPLPLPGWSGARGCFMVTGAVIVGGMAGLYCISLLIEWLTGG